MASGSNNEVSAKMIGAQLQSLLRIPPIKKVEESKTTERKQGGGTGKSNEESRKFASVEKSKEQGPRFGNSDETRKAVPNSEGNVARDRFGRPFQTIDRRGRGRDFQNGPRRSSSNINQRDAQPNPPTPNDNVGGVSTDPPTPHGNHVGGDIPQSTSRGRHPPLPPQPQPHVEKKNFIPPHRRAQGFDASVGPKPSKPTEPTAPASSMEERMPRVAPPVNSPYEKSPRFSSDEPAKPKVVEKVYVDPQLRQVSRNPHCPPDIRENIMSFQCNIEFACQLNEVVTSILYRHCVWYIHKRSNKFPRAKFYCKACNYHMDTTYATLLHIMQDRHTCLEKMQHIQFTCQLMPPPSAEHTSYLTDYLMKISKLHGMNHTEHMQRLDIVRRLSEGITGTDLDCEVMMFGSSLPGFGFRDSNVNININVGSEVSTMPLDNTGEPVSPKTTLTTANPSEFSEITGKLITIVKKLPYVPESKVREVYTPKCVSIHFEEEKTRAPCVIHFNNTSGVLAAQLFAEYDKIDPRVKPLVLCFRYWARVCDVDDQEKGFLPAHCFTIMVIMFLQRDKKILPILHDIPRHPSNKLFATAEEAAKHKATQENPVVNTQPIGELWWELLGYYACFNFKDLLISISRDTVCLPKGEKVWNRRMSIEDPIIPKSNLARSLSNNKICDYIIDKLKLSYLYFGIPREASGPLYDGIMGESGYMDKDVFQSPRVSSKPTTSQTLQRMVRQIQGIDVKGESNSDDEWNTGEDPKKYRLVKTFWKQKSYNYVSERDVKNMHTILFKKEYHYEFKPESFSDGSQPPIICKSCGGEGHLRRSCPEETVPPYLPVEYPSPLTIARLNDAINRNYEREVLDTLDVKLRQQIVDEVRTILLPVFPHVILQLFGSTFNGFGMHSSDVDICFTLDNVTYLYISDELEVRKIDVNGMLEKIVEALKGSGRMTDVLSIPSAKVPIVKFRHVAYKLDGDISLYNTLSIVNTNLLRLYNEIDNRVGRLGLFLKKLVKRCDVGDASKGSLSSYGYILMLIHFLQNHTVPVLPVLQELQAPGDPEKDLDPARKYLKDIKILPLLWEHYGKNRETVGQLWLAFLNYYVEKFDNERYVITISQLSPLSRISKCWYTEGIALEDPFDKTHNLGFGLTRRMSVHILRTLQKCRSFYHRSTDHLRRDISLLDYYLDPRHVRDGNPPIDRQCRSCLRIGHFARNCTYNKEEEVMRRQEEEMMRRPEEEDPFPPFRELPPKSLPENPRTPEKKTSKEDIGPLTSMMKKEERMNAFKFPVQQPPPVDANAWPVESHNLSSAGNGILQSQLPNGLATPFENLGKSVPFPLNGDTLGPVGHPHLLAQSLIPQTQSLMPQTQSTIPQTQSLIPQSHIITPKYHHEEVDEGKPAKVMFFGDIGSPNADGEQIQAMLQKNEGVTFTFDLASQRPLEHNNSDVMTTQEALANTMANTIVQPPPGFCPPGNVYMGNNPQSHNMQYMPDQGSRPIIPTPPTQPYNITPIGMSIQAPAVAYGHNPSGMAMSFQQMIPVGAMPYDGRSQVNGDSNDQRQPPVAAAAVAATAPPPGFAPLPTAATSNIIQPPEMIRSYPPPYAIQGAANMYTVAPVGMSYQPNSYSSAPSGAAETSEALIFYRPMENDIQTQAGTLNYYGNMMPQQQQPGNSYVASSQSLANMANVSGFQHVMPVNVGGVPNGQFENGEDVGELSGYHKTSSVTGEHLYNAEYGAMITANHPTASSYGLSLSQAHHGPVVSALQMQHSQHHPMQLQGGHFHHHAYHNVRPYMQVGAYPPGAPYSYPAMNVAQAQQMQQGHHDAMIPIGGESSGPGGLSSLEVKHMK
ncbi:unnamed protein product [Orchesella dallaii]|uniref:CCHC-type domain-containing protein n=1 Tax=Orchesella dallaii TaxID=48710 RepID=A0ABP1SB86_9HEXA